MKSSSNARRSVRLTALAAAATVAMSMSACSSNSLMHKGTTAGSYDGTTVTTTQVQSAVKQIGKVSKSFDGESAAAFMLLLPQLEKIGHKFGLAISAGQVKSMFPKTMDLSDATIRTARGSLLFTKLGQDPTAQKDVQKLIKNADVKLNPRYGQWVKGQGPKKDLAPWIKANKKKATAAATPQG